MKQVFTFLGCLLGSFASHAQDSLVIKAFTMGGGSREFGQYAMRISDTRSVLFNITSNCMTATCNHGMAGIVIDNNGNMLRYKKIGAITIDVDPSKAIYTSDGHILMVGAYGSPKRVLMKLDTLFNVVWTKMIEQKPSNTFTGPFIEDLVEVNHSYYLTFSNEITKIKEDGTVVFSKYYGPSATNTSSYTYINYKSIVPLSANRFFIGGELKDTASANELGFACIADSNGTIISQKKFNVGAPYGSDISYAFKEAANKIKVFGHYNNDIYTGDMDTALAVTNLKKYTGTPMYTHHVVYNGTDRYFLSAFDNTIPKTAVFAIDNDGTMKWSKFLNNGSGFFHSTNHMIDNCTFGVYNSTPIGTSLAHKGYWAKLNSDGTTGSGTAESALTLTTATTLSLTYSATTVTDSGQWQTTFANETFIADATPVVDSMWYELKNPVACTSVPSTGIVSAEQVQGLLLAPNPFSGSLLLSQDWDISQISELTFYDITGRIIFKAGTPGATSITLPQQATGVVIARWIYKGAVYTQRLLHL